MKLRLNCNSGFSLVEMLVGASILTLVAFSSAILVGETKRTENTGESLYHLNQTHLLALQKSKSIAELKAAIGLTPGSMLSNCFSGRGTGCNSYATSSWSLIPGSAITSTEVGQRTIASNSHYRIECAQATSCGSVVVRVQSSLFQGSTRLSSRDSEVRLSGVFLGDRQKLDFSCTATGGQFLTALDMTGLRGECLPLPSTPPCAGVLPMTQYLVAATPSCQPAVSVACANGLRTVGILSGQGVCM